LEVVGREKREYQLWGRKVITRTGGGRQFRKTREKGKGKESRKAIEGGGQ